MPDQELEGQGADSELASFGDELRREREIRGISLKEISDATKISKRFLEALERNDHKTLPAPVFTRGFVREYSRYVGLNADELVSRYNSAVQKDDRIEKPPEMQKYPQTPVRDITPKPPPKRGIPPVYARFNLNAVAALFIAVVLVVVAAWAIRQKRFDLDGLAETPANVPLTTTRAAITPPVLAPPVPDDSVLRLAVEAVDNSWVTLDADGKPVMNAEMVRGESRTFEAKETFRFRTIGNAAGLSLTLNGTVVPVLGEDGEVIKNRIFDRKALENLRGGSHTDPGTVQP